MNRDEFITAYNDFTDTALRLAVKARREGILVLDGDVDREKAEERDVFHYGLSFVIDGVASEIIEKILSNIVAQEKDEYTRILKTIQKEAVMGIQAGDNPKLLHCVLNSYTDLPIKNEEEQYE